MQERRLERRLAPMLDGVGRRVDGRRVRVRVVERDALRFFEERIELRRLRAVERTKTKREVPVVRSTGWLGEESKRRLTRDVKIERMSLCALWATRKLDLCDLVP